MNKPILGIIADDLTGCADAGQHFYEKGLRCVIAIHSNTLRRAHPSCDCLIINTESRFMSKSAAYETVYNAALFFRKLGCGLLFKKIDSTLRGNIGAESDALIDAFGLRTLPLCAAYPEAGRTTAGGTQYVRGMPVHMSEFGSDILNPVRESHIPDLLLKTSCHSKRIRVIDGTSAQDITAFARGYVSGHRDSLQVLCGSAGLARALAGAWAEEGYYGIRKRTRCLHIKGPVLVVQGSLNPVSQKQFRVARKSKKASVYYCATPIRRGNPGKVSGIIAGQCARMAKKYSARKLVLSGGHTAYRCLRHLRTGYLFIEGSIARGVVLCSSANPLIQCILKPGGFGANRTILRCISFFLKKNI